MVYTDNPAGRLQAYFERAFEQPQEETAQEGWCHVFELVHPGDLMFLAERFGRMAELAHETRDLVEGLSDDDPDVVLEHFEEVEKTLGLVTSMSNNKMSWFLSPLKGTGMHSLKLCSSLLHRRMPEPTLGDGERDQLLQQVIRLMGDVRDADDLDDDARDEILDKLADILRTLRNLDLEGAVPVRSAAESLVGSLVTQRGVWQRASKSSVAHGLYGLLVLIDIMLNITANYAQLEQPAPPSPTIVQIWTETTGAHPPPIELPAGRKESEENDGPPS